MQLYRAIQTLSPKSPYREILIQELANRSMFSLVDNELLKRLKDSSITLNNANPIAKLNINELKKLEDEVNKPSTSNIEIKTESKSSGEVDPDLYKLLQQGELWIETALNNKYPELQCRDLNILELAIIIGNKPFVEELFKLYPNYKIDIIKIFHNAAELNKIESMRFILDNFTESFGLNPGQVKYQDVLTKMHKGGNLSLDTMQLLVKLPGYGPHVVTGNMGMTLFEQALIQKSRLSVFEWLIKEGGYKSDGKNTNTGNSYLYSAVAFGRLDVFEYLIKDIRSPDWLEVDAEGDSLLHKAAGSGNQELFQRLFNIPNINFKLQNNAGETVFNKVDLKNLEFVKWLVEQKQLQPLLNIKGIYGSSPLFKAIDYFGKKEQDSAIIIALMKAGFRTAKDEGSIIHLLLNQFSFDNSPKDLLQNVIAAAHELKLELDINTPNNEGQTPLEVAIRKGFYQNALLLVEHKAEVNVKCKDQNSLLHLLLEKDWNTKDKLVSNQQAPTDLRKLFETLIASGASLDAKDYIGRTPLHCALSERSTPLSFGTVFGRVHMGFMSNNNNEMAKLLLEAKADATVKDKKDWTTLHYFAWQSLPIASEKNDLSTRQDQEKKIEILNYLIKSKVDLSAKNNDGNTALHIAVLRKSPGMCDVLIKHVPKLIYEKDREGRTALELALIQNTPELVKAIFQNYTPDDQEGLFSDKQELKQRLNEILLKQEPKNIPKA